MRRLLTHYERLTASTLERKADDAERERRASETAEQVEQRELVARVLTHRTATPTA